MGQEGEKGGRIGVIGGRRLDVNLRVKFLKFPRGLPCGIQKCILPGRQRHFFFFREGFHAGGVARIGGGQEDALRRWNEVESVLHYKMFLIQKR